MIRHRVAPRHIENLLAAVVLFGISLLIYSNTLQSPFVFDDAYLTESGRIAMKELSIAEIRDVLSRDNDYLNRPIPVISLALNHYFHTSDPTGYHIVNILIHGCASLLLFALFRLMLAASGRQEHAFAISMSAALLWSVHPIHTESVTYIIQRMTSMAAMFYILSLVCYIKGRFVLRGAPSPASGSVRTRAAFWFAGCGMAMLLAFGSKENTVMLPLTIILFEWYFFQELNSTWLKRAVPPLLLFVAVALALAYIYRGGAPVEQMLAGYQMREFTLTERVMTQWRVIMYYISQLALPLPSRLTLDHDYPLSAALTAPLTTLFSLAAIVALMFIVIYTARRHRLFSFCILWWLLNLVIESSVIELEIIYEHRTYLPSMMPALIAVIGLFHAVRPRWIAIVLVLTTTAFFAGCAFVRNRAWESRYTLYQDCARKAPNKPRALNNHAFQLILRGEYNKAHEYLTKTILLSPGRETMLKATINLAHLHLRKGRFDEAYRLIHPLGTGSGKDMHLVHHLAGRILLKLDRREEAMAELSRAVALRPSDTGIIESLAQGHIQTGDPQKAETLYRQSLEIDPRAYNSHNSLGVLYYEKGDMESAVFHFGKAIAHYPGEPVAGPPQVLGQILFNMGLAIGVLKGPEHALPYFREALDADPQSAEIHYRAGRALLETGKKEPAATHFRKALEIKPGFSPATFLLGQRLVDRGDIEEALALYLEALKHDPGLILAYLHAGNLYAMKGNVAEAIRLYTIGIEKAPDNRDLLQNRTLLVNLVVDRYDRLLTENPENIDARFALAEFLLTVGNSDDAAAHFETLLGYAPDHRRAVNRLALAYWQSERYEASARMYEKLARLVPGRPAIMFNIACAYSRADLTEQACAWLRRALDRGYDNRKTIETSPDLENLRKAECYQTIGRRPEFPAGDAR